MSYSGLEVILGENSQGVFGERTTDECRVVECAEEEAVGYRVDHRLAVHDGLVGADGVHERIDVRLARTRHEEVLRVVVRVRDHSEQQILGRVGLPLLHPHLVRGARHAVLVLHGIRAWERERSMERGGVALGPGQDVQHDRDLREAGRNVLLVLVDSDPRAVVQVTGEDGDPKRLVRVLFALDVPEDGASGGDEPRVAVGLTAALEIGARQAAERDGVALHQGRVDPGDPGVQPEAGHEAREDPCAGPSPPPDPTSGIRAHIDSEYASELPPVAISGSLNKTTGRARVLAARVGASPSRIPGALAVADGRFPAVPCPA